jgi:NCS1 family nucleobase:cation symporter-1
MERLRGSKYEHYAAKLAVSSEPGLTNAQLMLTNDDLKPGESSFTVPCFGRSSISTFSIETNGYFFCLTVEPERRQWGPWNFVGFWIADSFNIVGERRFQTPSSFGNRLNFLLLVETQC